jgi:hypothetical protein
VLHFGAADSCALCWLNGALVGAWKDARLPAEVGSSVMISSREREMKRGSRQNETNKDWARRGTVISRETTRE